VNESYRLVEQAARDSRARLLAFLVARWHDVAAAEDALAEAFRAALETWPRTGVPEKPEAWLLVTARRKLLDGLRHQRVHDAATPELMAATQEAYEIPDAGVQIPDERLELLFLCAHPAIDEAVRTPLMLQTVLGLNAARIASAFIVNPSAMGQRLTRAKTKIRVARIRFNRPEPSELVKRLEYVLEAIYGAYGTGWNDAIGADGRRKGLAAEAIVLGRLIVQFMPTEPEAKGLLALMLHCEARREARRNAVGDYVPLSEQDTSQWSVAMLQEAEALLTEAARMQRLGRFQLEAAIQSAHAQRAKTGRVDWLAITVLYEGLAHLWPTIGALVGRAAAVAEARGAAAGLALLEAISPTRVESYQPYWALAGDLFNRLDRTLDAGYAYDKAMGLCEEPALRDFLARQSSRLGSFDEIRSVGSSKRSN
jgi:predicted RNA polymerase sigma factor